MSGDKDQIRVRRFERGASGEGWDQFLVDHGWVIKGAPGGTNFKVSRGTGRPKTVTKRGLMAILDAERIAAGLEPIQLNSAPCSVQFCAEAVHGETSVDTGSSHPNKPRARVDRSFKKGP